MSISSYDAALARLLAHEGGYTNDAADPGGPTNFGITIYDYRKYVKPDATAADVKRDEGRGSARRSIAPNIGTRSAATNCRPASITPCSITA